MLSTFQVLCPAAYKAKFDGYFVYRDAGRCREMLDAPPLRSMTALRALGMAKAQPITARRFQGSGRLVDVPHKVSISRGPSFQGNRRCAGAKRLRVDD